MDKLFRERVIDALLHDKSLPADWARILFPPEKREAELVYHGKEREEGILADTMSVPLQPVRSFGRSAAWNNYLIFGDNLQAMKTLLRMKEEGQICSADGTPGVRLVYIDPPFGTGDEYGTRDAEMAYSAKVQGTKFMEFLRKRLIVLRELMADDGTIYVRLDYHFGHYIKVLLDEIFGQENFQNEIVINRFKRQLRNLGRFNVATDSLFFYSRASRFHFHEHLRGRLCSFCGQETPPAWLPMSSPGLRNPAERIILGEKLLPPRGRHWTFKQDTLDVMQKAKRIRLDTEAAYYDLNGRRVVGVPEYLQTEETPVDSDWTDLKGYVRSARYPTENPEELLARVIEASSREGDLVLDAFAGSGTTVAVAEKLRRRWIGIDSGKLSVYTIQKRLLHLKADIGNSGRSLAPSAFTLYNAGLYDFASLRDLPWEDWRFFALQLFGCKDEPHEIGGLQLDGKLKGSSVLVFNHHQLRGKRIDEDTVRDIHLAIGKQIGRRFFIIAPRGVFDFQQDYLDLDGVRYYALRIPYSIINELHARSFTALEQPRGEAAINATVDAVGFDFIRPPQVKWIAGSRTPKGTLLPEAVLKIRSFVSTTRIRGTDQSGGLETFAMLMLDLDYDGDVFDLDEFYLAEDLQRGSWEISLPASSIGKQAMAVFIDIYGNESREVIPRAKFGLASSTSPRDIPRARRQHAA
jgi:site-specific DNA-methyltransferase (adenine-specific)/adenine-specific DNA-methyltransferase